MSQFVDAPLQKTGSLTKHRAQRKRIEFYGLDLLINVTAHFTDEHTFPNELNTNLLVCSGQRLEIL